METKSATKKKAVKKALKKNSIRKTAAKKITRALKPQFSADGEAKKDLARTYNKFKEFEGKQYTGMKVGRGHKWYYDQVNGKRKK